jgi:CheY-like chemotaxis protein
MKTILLVEDDEDLREIMASVLRDAGYYVSEAEHGLEALEQLDQMPSAPCLVLLDLMMPIMSGPEFLSELRSAQRIDSLNIVVLSASGKTSDAPEAKRFIRKPFDSAVLLGLAEEFCCGEASH